MILILWLFVAITVVYLFLKVKKQYDSMQDIHPDDTVSEEVVAKNLKNANQAHKQVKFIERKILDPSTLFALIATFLYFICSLALPPTSKLRLLDYSTVVNDKSNGYVGKTVQWRGVIAGLSQLDGIKFWVVDKNHTSFDDSYHDWFWAVPDDLLSLDTEQTHGAWVLIRLEGLVTSMLIQ